MQGGFVLRPGKLSQATLQLAEKNNGSNARHAGLPESSLEGPQAFMLRPQESSHDAQRLDRWNDCNKGTSRFGTGERLRNMRELESSNRFLFIEEKHGRSAFMAKTRSSPKFGRERGFAAK